MNEYTPEKVAELVEKLIAHRSVMPWLGGPAAALDAVSAEHDRLHKAITEALAAAPKLGELRWRNVDRMIGILRAALDKEGGRQ